MGGKTQGLACRGKRGVARSSLAKLPAPPAAGWEDGRKASSQREAAGDAPRSERNCQICGAQRTFRSSYTAVWAKSSAFRRMDGKAQGSACRGKRQGIHSGLREIVYPPWLVVRQTCRRKRRVSRLFRTEFPVPACRRMDGTVENPSPNAGGSGRCALARAELPAPSIAGWQGGGKSRICRRKRRATRSGSRGTARFSPNGRESARLGLSQEAREAQNGQRRLLADGQGDKTPGQTREAAGDALGLRGTARFSPKDGKTRGSACRGKRQGIHSGLREIVYPPMAARRIRREATGDAPGPRGISPLFTVWRGGAKPRACHKERLLVLSAAGWEGGGKPCFKCRKRRAMRLVPSGIAKYAPLSELPAVVTPRFGRNHPFPRMDGKAQGSARRRKRRVSRLVPRGVSCACLLPDGQESGHSQAHWLSPERNRRAALCPREARFLPAPIRPYSTPRK